MRFHGGRATEVQKTECVNIVNYLNVIFLLSVIYFSLYIFNHHLLNSDMFVSVCLEEVQNLWVIYWS